MMGWGWVREKSFDIFLRVTKKKKKKDMTQIEKF